MMKRKLLCIFALVLALSVCARAQFSNTIFQTATTLNGSGVFSNWTPPVTGATIANIGQSVHTYSILTFSKPTKTCTAWTVGQLQGSFDSSNFVTLPTTTVIAQQPTGAVNSGDVLRVQQANGAYPFLRLVVAAPDNTNCTYTAAYTGVLQTFALPIPGVNTNGGGISTFANTIAAMGPTTLAANGFNAGISVYALTVCNRTAGQDVTFQDEAAHVLWFLPNMQAGECVTLPLSGGVVFSTTQQSTSQLRVATNAGTTISVLFSMKIE